MKTKVFLLLSIFSWSVYALDIDDLDVGDDVYVQGIFSDDLVYVIRIDKQGNRVKVRNYENNTTKWVSSSDLISKKTSDTNDVGRLGAGALILGCLFTDACSDSDKDSKKSSSSRTTEPHELFVTNDCGAPIQMVVTYKDQNQNWQTKGWWYINGYGNSFLTDKENNNILLSDTKFYYFAESPQYNLIWEGNDYTVNTGERKLGMRKGIPKDTFKKAHIFSLSCEGNDPLKGKYLLGFHSRNIESFTYDGDTFKYGVEITSILDSSSAEEAGLEVGDILYQMDESKITEPKSIVDYMNDPKKEKGSSVRIHYMRGGQLYSKKIRPKYNG
jgi:hypothetical protein